MKISDPSSRLVSGLAQTVRPAASGRTGSSAEGSPPGDQIQLSNLLAGLLQSGSTEHLARLSQLGAAVAKGQYHVDANAVSAGIIQQSLAFGGA